MCIYIWLLLWWSFCFWLCHWKCMLMPNVGQMWAKQGLSVLNCHHVHLSACIFLSCFINLLCIFQAWTTVSNIKYAAFPCSALSYTLLSMYFKILLGLHLWFVVSSPCVTALLVFFTIYSIFTPCFLSNCIFKGTFWYYLLKKCT